MNKIVSRNAPNDAHTPRRGCMNDKSVGTDFRYAVEFSKIKRAPSKAFQPSPGQPDQRYPIFLRVTTRWSLRFPWSWAERVLIPVRFTGAELRVLLPGSVQLRRLPCSLSGSPLATTRKLRACVRQVKCAGQGFGDLDRCSSGGCDRPAIRRWRRRSWSDAGHMALIRRFKARRHRPLLSCHGVSPGTCRAADRWAPACAPDP